jgi:membrane complex biogenesis BtpA family protein
MPLPAPADRILPPWLTAGRPLFIGVVHLLPLPGSARWGGDFDAVLDRAMADALAYARGGTDALIVENFGDAPFAKLAVGPETVAAMCAAGRAVREALADADRAALPLGYNVLRNDARAALALCAAAEGAFVRVNVHTGSAWTDQGLIEGDAHGTAQYRRRVCPCALIFADVHVKHAQPAGPGQTIEEAAHDTRDRGLAEALIVTGSETGQSADLAAIARVRRACPETLLLVGSGVTTENVANCLRNGADGCIVGSACERGGRAGNAVEEARVAALREAMGC